jgi:hypothetical protein
MRPIRVFKLFVYTGKKSCQNPFGGVCYEVIIVFGFHIVGLEKLELFIGLQFPSGEFQVPGSCGIVEPAHPQAGRANHSIYIKIFKELG